MKSFWIITCLFNMLSYMGSNVKQMIINFLRLSLWVNAISVLKPHKIPKVLIGSGITSSFKLLIIKMLFVTKITIFPCQLHCNELSSVSSNHVHFWVFCHLQLLFWCSGKICFSFKEIHEEGFLTNTDSWYP